MQVKCGQIPLCLEPLETREPEAWELGTMGRLSMLRTDVLSSSHFIYILKINTNRLS